MRATGPASARKHGPLGQGPDQTYGDESDKASIEGNSNHGLNIGMEQLTCHHREKTWMKQAQMQTESD